MISRLQIKKSGHLEKRTYVTRLGHKYPKNNYNTAKRIGNRFALGFCSFYLQFYHMVFAVLPHVFFPDFAVLPPDFCGIHGPKIVEVLYHLVYHGF